MLFKARTKIYIWDSENKEWKERGLGNISIIKNEDDKKIRAVHCQEQTFKLRAFFYIFGENLCNLTKMESAKNAYLFSCIDYSSDDNKPVLRRFGIRFNNEDDFKKFKEVFEESKKHNDSLECFNVAKKDEKNECEKKCQKECEKECPKESE